MVLKLTKDKVAMGTILPVQNLGKKINENLKYFALKIEDEDGKKEEWLLFTEKEINQRSELDMGYITDMWKPGRIHPHNVGKQKSYAVKILLESTPKTILIGKSVLETARKRAKRNPEDIPRQSRLSDLLD